MESSERLVRLETMVESIVSELPSMKEALDRHDKACDIHAPMAQQAHEATTTMSREIGVVSEALSALVKGIDAMNKSICKLDEKVDNKLAKIDQRNEEADKENAKFRESIATKLGVMTGKNIVKTWLMRAYFAGTLTFMLWATNEFKNQQHHNDTHHHNGKHEHDLPVATSKTHKAKIKELKKKGNK